MPTEVLACCDTRFLISFYGSDLHSKKATDFISKFRGRVTLSALNCYEMEQSLNFLAWRKLISPAYRDTLKRSFDADCVSGSMEVVACNFLSVFTRAQRLSSRYTETVGQRSMDILIVANALELKAEYLLSFDNNQRKLAKAEGLKLNP